MKRVLLPDPPDYISRSNNVMGTDIYLKHDGEINGLKETLVRLPTRTCALMNGPPSSYRSRLLVLDSERLL